MSLAKSLIEINTEGTHERELVPIYTTLGTSYYVGHWKPIEEENK